MDDLSEVVARLEARLDTLEGRVFSLEHSSDRPISLPASSISVLEAVSHPNESSLAQGGATFAVVGRAMLGMAGAYLLRAIAESGSFPKLAVVALAIAYAAMWLILAVRVPERAWFASTTYAATSALILAPVLWELTLRFQFLPPTIAATVLGAFTLGAYALAWKRNLAPIVWVAACTSAFASLALLIATRDLLPFLAVLLLTALLSEISACRNHWLSIRPVTALASDIAVCALVSIYSTSAESRAAYASLGTSALLAPAIILLVIYGSSVVLRTNFLHLKITLFEVAQTMAAFVLAAEAVLRLAPPQGSVVLGAVCLLIALAGYIVICFNRFENARNYHVYATWSLTLLIGGLFLCLQGHWLATCLGIASILTTFVGTQHSRLTLQFHGLAYLIAAAFASGLLQYINVTLIGTLADPPSSVAWMIAGSAVLCYVLIGQNTPATSRQKLLQTLSAALAVGAVVTALISIMVWIAARMTTPDPSHIAVIRTLAACILALALAYCSSRWQRPELLWITYAALALVAAKLLIEDLRQGHPEFIAASIFLYAVTLILVPRLARSTSKKPPTITAA